MAQGTGPEGSYDIEMEEDHDSGLCEEGWSSQSDWQLCCPQGG